MGGGKGGGGSGGGQNTVVNQSSPPQQVLDAYTDITKQAFGQSTAPLEQYQGAYIAGFSPQQLQAFQTVQDAQGVANPYINAATQLYGQATNPVTPTAFSGDQIAQYLNPYTQNVVNATAAQFANQNAQQAQQLTGNAIAKGAFGGDRSDVAQAILAGQQQLAQAPTIANLESQGYGQALQEFNTQQQQGIGAQEASNWLATNAAQGIAGLGNQAQQSALAGANALESSGALQQQLSQEQLNIPYQLFTQSQAYPFQTIGWNSNIAESMGAGSGGTSTSTQPGASLGSQIVGGAVGLTGLAGMTGGFGSNGWLYSTGENGSGLLNSAYNGISSMFQNRGGRIGKAEGGPIAGFMPVHHAAAERVGYAPGGGMGIGNMRQYGSTTSVGDARINTGVANGMSLPNILGDVGAAKFLYGLGAPGGLFGAGGFGQWSGLTGALGGQQFYSPFWASSGEALGAGTDLLAGTGAAAGFGGADVLAGGAAGMGELADAGLVLMLEKGGRVHRDAGGQIPGEAAVGLSPQPPNPSLSPIAANAATPHPSGRSTLPAAPSVQPQQDPVDAAMGDIKNAALAGAFKRGNDEAGKVLYPTQAGAETAAGRAGVGFGDTPANIHFGESDPAAPWNDPAQAAGDYARGGRLHRDAGGQTGSSGGQPAMSAAAQGESPLIAGFTTSPGRGIALPVLATGATGGNGSNLYGFAAPGQALNIRTQGDYTPPPVNTSPYTAITYPILNRGASSWNPPTTTYYANGSAQTSSSQSDPYSTPSWATSYMGAHPVSSSPGTGYTNSASAPSWNGYVTQGGNLSSQPNFQTYWDSGVGSYNSGWTAPPPPPPPLTYDGGAVKRGGRIHRDAGGSLTAGMVDAGVPMAAGPTPGAQGSYQRFAGMNEEQLAELAQRLPPSSPYGQMARTVLQAKRMNPTQGQQQMQPAQGSAPSPVSGMAAPAQGVADPGVSGLASGGRLHFDAGGVSVNDPGAPTDPWPSAGGPYIADPDARIVPIGQAWDEAIAPVRHAVEAGRQGVAAEMQGQHDRYQANHAIPQPALDPHPLEAIKRWSDAGQKAVGDWFHRQRETGESPPAAPSPSQAEIPAPAAGLSPQAPVDLDKVPSLVPNAYQSSAPVDRSGGLARPAETTPPAAPSPVQPSTPPSPSGFAPQAMAAEPQGPVRDLLAEGRDAGYLRDVGDGLVSVNEARPSQEWVPPARPSDPGVAPDTSRLPSTKAGKVIADHADRKAKPSITPPDPNAPASALPQASGFAPALPTDRPKIDDWTDVPHHDVRVGWDTSKTDENGRPAYDVTPWQALTTAGFAMMAGRSPNTLENLGRGALAGVQEFGHEKEQAQRHSDIQFQQDLENRRDRLQTQTSQASLYHQGIQDQQAAAKAQEDRRQFDAKQAEEQRWHNIMGSYYDKIGSSSGSADAGTALMRNAQWLVDKGIAPDITSAYSMIHSGVNTGAAFDRAVQAEKKLILSNPSNLNMPPEELERRAIETVKARANAGSAHGVSTPPSLPAQAVSQLKEGVGTRFNNGQVWTLRNGQPVQVQ